MTQAVLRYCCGMRRALRRFAAPDRCRAVSDQGNWRQDAHVRREKLRPVIWHSGIARVVSAIALQYFSPLTGARYHWHVFCNPQVSNLHHLCAALLVDLGLTRPPDRLYQQKWQLFGIKFIHGPAAHREIRSMTERRALAGCYYMSNV